MEDIQNRIEKLIDYKEIARILELDLNLIAQQVVEDPTEYIEFKVFFDSGEFDTTIKMQAPGEGQGLHITPVLLSLTGGDYSTQKGPQVFQLRFIIETLAFLENRENVRKIFEVYSSMNQGQVVSDPEITQYFGGAMITSITDFPTFSEPIQYKGFDRVQGFLSQLMTFIYSGQLSNEVEIKLNGALVNLQQFNIKRLREGDSIQLNGEDETKTTNISQTLVFSGAMIYDGSEEAKMLMRNIKNKNITLNEVIEFKVGYPMLEDVDSYDVIITEGEINVNQGGYVSLVFSAVLAG